MVASRDIAEDKQSLDFTRKMLLPAEIAAGQFRTTQNFMAAFSKYSNEFLIPFMLATIYFQKAEQERLLTTPVEESLSSYWNLAGFNLDIFNRNLLSTVRVLGGFGNMTLSNAMEALTNTVFDLPGEDLGRFVSRQERLIENVVRVYPEAIDSIAPEYGFHFERGNDEKVAETDRFILYRVNPTDTNVACRFDAKPILIVPPYVLGANILGFLPGEQKSYTHAFANQGLPTYIRIMKPIAETPAVQTMTGEDDAEDTRHFCEIMKKRHGKPVTLNGYCQGGYTAVCDVISGKLDGLVDALLTCVSPMDGTRSLGLSGFLGALPPRFNDLAYGTKELANGNCVADGKLMSWVYKLKSIEAETPIVAMIRDMMMLKPKNGDRISISKTAAALNYWLLYERSDLPLPITDMSFRSYNIPVTKDGTLPVKLFGKTLNFKRIQEKKIPWLICYGQSDDLVEQSTALAPADFIPVETSPFPKGHVAIATSWSHPESPFALHTRFGENHQYRGPIRYQLDLDEALGKPAAAPKKKKKSVSKKTAKTGKAQSKGKKTPESPDAGERQQAKSGPAKKAQTSAEAPKSETATPTDNSKKADTSDQSKPTAE